MDVGGAGSVRNTRARGARSIAAVSLCALMVALPGVAGADPLITAAGDIATEEPSADQIATARLVRRIDPHVALTLGDNQYPDGQLKDYRDSYAPTWGTFKSITRPVPGNHEYHVPGAKGYFHYFGRRAHPKHGGYYSFDLGRWHLLALNSGTGSISTRQLRWVCRDLRRDGSRCEIAYWHHPRWSSGALHGSDKTMAPLWRALFRAGVDVVLNGHEHNYERFAPLAPSGRVAPNKGIRQFVVGTGGAGLYPFGRAREGSRRRINHVAGVIRLRLHNKGYRWAFVGTGGGILDDGNGRCHAAATAITRLAGGESTVPHSAGPGDPFAGPDGGATRARAAVTLSALRRAVAIVNARSGA